MKIVFLACYSLILIPGFMIATPLSLALISWCFEANLFLRLSAIGAVLGVLGIIFNRYILSNKLTIDIIGFLLLVAPLFNRLVAFPKKLGAYVGFYIPAIFFLIFFFVYVLLKHRGISR